MASPAPRPPHPPWTGPDVGDADADRREVDPAHRVLLLAHEAAEETLADAQRLAAGLLSEAGRQADALVGNATDAMARSAAEQAAVAVAGALVARHDDIVAMITQVREELRGVSDALTQPPAIAPPPVQRPVEEPFRHGGYGQRRSVLAADPYAALSRSDEEFIDEVYRRIAGVASSAPRSAGSPLPGDRVAALRASAQRAGERAAAERAAIQAEALERQAVHRRRDTAPPASARSDTNDVVVSMAERRGAVGSERH